MRAVAYWQRWLGEPPFGAGWVSRKEYGELMPRNTALAGFSLKDAVPDLTRFARTLDRLVRSGALALLQPEQKGCIRAGAASRTSLSTE